MSINPIIYSFSILLEEGKKETYMLKEQLWTSLRRINKSGVEEVMSECL